MKTTKQQQKKEVRQEDEVRELSASKMRGRQVHQAMQRARDLPVEGKVNAQPPRWALLQPVNQRLAGCNAAKKNFEEKWKAAPCANSLAIETFLTLHSNATVACLRWNAGGLHATKNQTQKVINKLCRDHCWQRSFIVFPFLASAETHIEKCKPAGSRSSVSFFFFFEPTPLGQRSNR